MLFALALALAGPALPDPTERPGGMTADNPDAVDAVNAEVTGLARLTIDALLPVEVWIDGAKFAQLWAPATTTVQLAPGPHLVRVYAQGKPADQQVNLVDGANVRVVVGRGGVSVEEATASDDQPTVVPVEFRVLGARGASLRIGDERHAINAGDRLSLDLDVGPHLISVRSSDGTVIWASGRLSVTGGAPLVIHLGEGRMPEVSGGGRFDPGHGG